MVENETDVEEEPKPKPKVKLFFRNAKQSKKKPDKKKEAKSGGFLGINDAFKSKPKAKKKKPKGSGFLGLRGALRKKGKKKPDKKKPKGSGFHLRGALRSKLRGKTKKKDGFFEGLKGKKLDVVKKLRYKFSISEPKKLVVIPKSKDIRKTDFKYPLLEPFAYANVKWSEDEEKILYTVIEPVLSDKEKKILEKIEKYLTEMIDVKLSKLKDMEKIIEYLQGLMETALTARKIKLKKESYEKIMYYIFRDFLGLNEIEPLMHDPYIEDIGCVGSDSNVYIVHRTFGSIETSIIFKDSDYLENFVIKIAEKCGRYVSYAQPLFDGSLPDGSRVQATLARDVTTKGSSFSIRKFRKHPFSPTDLINLKTTSPKMMAYLWVLIENSANMLVCGGVASGKTTFLNTLSMFIPSEKKIVSIEDTREIQLPHENWIPSVTRPGFGMPEAGGVRYGEVNLFQLLKESFRQNPNYTIVGEVRGEEAFVLFQSMASGNPALGTIHAGSVDDVVKRLKTRPIELSPSLIEALDVIVMMINAREKGSSSRRVREIEEIKSVDTDTEKAETVKTFTWIPTKDMFESDIEESDVLRKIALEKGFTVKKLLEEVEDRKNALEWMRKHKIVQFDEVSALINLYYKDKKTIMLWVEKDLEPYKTKTKKDIMKMFKN
ncbi:MAG: type II/IV secretion system ATPase subunit [Candidatus Aenigmarchaeota archaeon]|nr:type II/IV secretion system ATPase subunit [Candidatus Aenigmarchaeota archaeon]